MDPVTQRRLLDLNRRFYRQVAAEFSRTRAQPWPGFQRLLAHFPPAQSAPLQVVDVGCGNGRFAQFLAAASLPCAYTGVDADAQLLALARASTAALEQVESRFVAADLALPTWYEDLGAAYDVVLCLATLHHLPGLGLRQRVVGELAALCRPSGVLLLSAWQFLGSDRLAARQLGWERIGLKRAAVEPGDALLPWNHDAVRYVHQIDEVEMARLAQAAGLTVVELFRADGREGDLNLYAILRPGASCRSPGSQAHSGAL